jgi:hypothetical protein
MPFFVFRIRNEVISINNKMQIMVDLLRVEFLGGTEITETRKKVIPSRPAPDGKMIKEVEVVPRNMKLCPHCGAKNRKMDSLCINCGKRMK